MTLDLSEPAISCVGSVGGGGVSAAGHTEGGQDQHDSVLDCRFGQSQPSPDLPVGHAFDDLKSGSVLAGVSARVLSLGLLHHGSSCCHFSRMGVVGGPGVCSPSRVWPGPPERSGRTVRRSRQRNAPTRGMPAAPPLHVSRVLGDCFGSAPPPPASPETLYTTLLLDRGLAGRLSDDEHVEGPRAVHPFDAFQFDVAGGGRAGDHGQRPDRI